MEVHYDRRWGTICDDSWDINDATVVCRNLGFPAAKEAKIKAFFGQGNGPIWLSNMLCKGTESSLNGCFSWDKWGFHTCSHREDAGVVCSTGKMNCDYINTSIEIYIMDLYL